MSASYFIMIPFPEKYNWRIPLDPFREALIADWLNITINISPAYHKISLEWSDEIAKYQGFLFIENSSVSMEGFLEGILEFAVWFRNFIPLKFPLLFIDSFEENYCLILEETTVERLEYDFENTKKSLSLDDMLAQVPDIESQI